MMAAKVEKEFTWDEVIHHKIIVRLEPDRLSLIRDGRLAESFTNSDELELNRMFNEMVNNVTTEVDNARCVNSSNKS